MKNDFYVGIFEDNYLAHGAKGRENANHKYIARYWKNGRWYYIYDQKTYNAIMKHKQKEQADISTLTNAINSNKKPVNRYYVKNG